MLPPGRGRGSLVDMRASILALLLLVAAAGCDDDGISRELGATCEAPDECAAICLRPTEGWPGGLCTIPCVDDRGCPGDASCVDEAGGACLYRCDRDPDCGHLGTTGGVAWVCRPRLTPGAATVTVCVGP